MKDFSRHTKVEFTEISFHVLHESREADFQKIFLLTDRDSFFVRNLREILIERILGKQIHHTNTAKYRTSEIRRKFQ